MTTETVTETVDPHPRYGPCDAMGFEEGACSECERMSLSPAEYEARQQLHCWKMFKRLLGEDFLHHYMRLPHGSRERAECREMIDVLSKIHQAREGTDADKSAGAE